MPPSAGKAVLALGAAAAAAFLAHAFESSSSAASSTSPSSKKPKSSPAADPSPAEVSEASPAEVSEAHRLLEEALVGDGKSPAEARVLSGRAAMEESGFVSAGVVLPAGSAPAGGIYPQAHTSEDNAAPVGLPVDGGAAPAAQPEEQHSCPICIEDVAREESAMRCSNAHYFHEPCLRTWIRAQRTNGGNATCPMCRGPIEVHAARLGAYLDGAAGAELEPEERGLLEMLVARAKEAGGAEWTAVRREDLKKWGANAMGFGWGAYSGWKGRPWGAADELALQLAPRQAKLSLVAGWAVGTAARAISSLTSEDKDEERRRGRR